jgi:DNA-binding MarR family transcriptional regulator
MNGVAHRPCRPAAGACLLKSTPLPRTEVFVVTPGLNIGSERVYTHNILKSAGVSFQRSPMATRSLPNSADCNCLAVRQAARYITQFYDRHLATAGLRTTQYGILVRLKRQGPMSINTLAAELVVDRTTLGRNIRLIERDGLIAIESDPSDRRSKILRLTTVGETRFQRAQKHWAEAQKRFEHVYGGRRASQLRDNLRAVVASELGPFDTAIAE